MSFHFSEHYHGKNPNKKKISEKSRSKAFQEENDDLENQIEEYRVKND